MKQTNITLNGMMMIAVSFSIFGQGIAYFLNDHFETIEPVFYLTALTVISIGLYVTAPIYVYRYFKKEKIRGQKMESYLMSIAGIAIPTSLWSVFVLAMWWG